MGRRLQPLAHLDEAPSLVTEHGVSVSGLGYAVATHIGSKDRALNEDRTLCVPETGLFAVADGMGGHDAGEVAATLALDVLKRTVRERLRSRDAHHRQEVLHAGVEAANLNVWEAGGGEQGGKQRMGTTLDAILFAGPFVVGAHVGDSRVYQYRDGRLRQLTEDHTLVGAFQRAGKMTAEEAAASEIGHVITRALGVENEVLTDPFAHRVAPGDLYLLCTDGLHGAITDEEIVRGLALGPRHGPKAALEELFRTAIPWAKDNLSAVLVRVEGP